MMSPISRILVRVFRSTALAIGLLAAISKGYSAEPCIANVAPSRLELEAISAPLPQFPRSELSKRTRGVAVAAIQVDPKGRIVKLTVLESPAKAMSIAILRALGQWRFKPRLMGDCEVSGKVIWYFTVDLRGQGKVLDSIAPTASKEYLEGVGVTR